MEHGLSHGRTVMLQGNRINASSSSQRREMHGIITDMLTDYTKKAKQGSNR